jgi:hypothetical protein
MIEQDHRKVKQRCYPMLGFETFGNAEVTLSGIELANKIKKGQFDASEINGPGAMILQRYGKQCLPRKEKWLVRLSRLAEYRLQFHSRLVDRE